MNFMWGFAHMNTLVPFDSCEVCEQKHIFVPQWEFYKQFQGTFTFVVCSFVQCNYVTDFMEVCWKYSNFVLEE